MTTPVIWVTASLTTATIIVATLLIAEGTRGEASKPSSALPVAQPAMEACRLNSICEK